MSIVEWAIREGQRDSARPWWRRTTGGLLVLVVFAVIGLGVVLSGS